MTDQTGERLAREAEPFPEVEDGPKIVENLPELGPENDKLISLRLPLWLSERLQKLAKANGQSRSDLIRQVLRHYVG